MTKILLVEDDKSLREIYGVRLLAEGYDIVSAGDGEEALAMAIKDRPDLILSDVMMPKISGFDMLDILRSTTETKTIKVIMMTALSSEEQRQRGVALGADRYLVKSQVGIEDVVRAVHEVLADAPVSSSPSAPAATVPPRQASPSLTPSAPSPPANTSASAAPASSPSPVAPTTPLPVTTPQPGPNLPPPTAVAPTVLPTPTAPITGSVPPVPPSVTPTESFTPAAPKQTLASRVIEPLPPTGQSSPDFGNLMSQELSQAAPVPASDRQPSATTPPPTPPSAMPTGVQFEETPLPMPPAGSSATPSQSPTTSGAA